MSAVHTDVLAAIRANHSAWVDSISLSRANESLCGGKPPTPSPPGGCEWHLNTGLGGGDVKVTAASSKEECCDLCKATAGCAAADYNSAFAVYSSVPREEGVFSADEVRGTQYLAGYKCHLKSAFEPKPRGDGSIACIPQKSAA